MTAKTKEKEKNSAIIIALIGLAGTLIAALLGSPLLKKWLETPTPTATQPVTLTQVFHADFETGTVSGFAFDGEVWSVVNDKADKVLRIDAEAVPAGAFTRITFGPADFADGSVAFRLKWDTPGEVVLGFHDSGTDSYSLRLLPGENQVRLGYGGTDGGGGVSHAFTFQSGTWYAVELNTLGSSMTLNIDGNRLLTWEDDHLTGGPLYLYVISGTLVKFDDFNVWAANR